MESLSRLLHGDEEWPLKNRDRWLRHFWGWDGFIEKNYLQDFVDKDNTSIPFCKGHTWRTSTPADLGEFFETATELILKRGKRMTEALRKAL